MNASDICPSCDHVYTNVWCRCPEVKTCQNERHKIILNLMALSEDELSVENLPVLQG